MRENSRLVEVLILGALFALPAVARGKDRAFDEIVHRIESYYHKRPVPMMGLASFVANRSHTEGVRNMKLAVFEDLAQNPPDSDFDPYCCFLLSASCFLLPTSILHAFADG